MGGPEACDLIYSDDIVAPAKLIRQWVSGDPRRSRLFKDSATAEFLITIFYLIQLQSVNSEVVLTGMYSFRDVFDLNSICRL